MIKSCYVMKYRTQMFAFDNVFFFVASRQVLINLEFLLVPVS